MLVFLERTKSYIPVVEIFRKAQHNPNMYVTTKELVLVDRRGLEPHIVDYAYPEYL